MGWLIYPDTPSDIKAEIARILTGPQTTPIKICRVGSTWYAAVKATPSQPPSDFTLSPDGTYTFAAVILTSIKKGEWGYKDMDETMGPSASQCPKSILKLLSPTTSTYANNWRERCQRNAEPLPTRFMLPAPLKFGNFTAQRFEKVNLPGYRMTYRDIDSGKLVRLNRWHLEGATPCN